MMNQRIQELWDQAAKSTAAYPSGQNNSWETQVNFMDKFAELIVREVFEIIDDEASYTIYAPVVQLVKERFGINDE